MTRNDKVFVAVGLWGLFAWLVLSERGKNAASSAGEIIYEGIMAVEKMMRGESLNNPGNIEKSTNKWQGKVASPDSRFEAFTTPYNGIRALAKLMFNYYSNYGLNTVAKIINRYAPRSDNAASFENYVNSVSAALGVGANDVINVANVLPDLVKAIIRFEQGRVIYSDILIAEASNAALPV